MNGVSIALLCVGICTTVAAACNQAWHAATLGCLVQAMAYLLEAAQ